MRVMPEYVYMTDLPRPDKAVIECRKPTTTKMITITNQRELEVKTGNLRWKT